MKQIQKKPAKHLISAYNQIMIEMRNAFEQSETNKMSLQTALDMAKHQTANLGEVTLEEAHEIGEYIKRDINDSAEYMMESSAEFYDWLMLDIEVIERKVMDMFLSVADNTRNELEKFKFSSLPLIQKQANQVAVYLTGETTTACTLICENCANTSTFFSNSKISDCKRCGHHRFIRRHSENE